MIELLTQILCDITPSVQPDGAYLFAQTADNQQSVFTVALDLLKQQQTQKIVISAAGSLAGYPGFASWRQELMSLGLTEANLVAVPSNNASLLHTRIEAESLVNFALAQSWAKLFVVSAPFHQLRAFMTTVTLALETFPELQIYSRAGAALPWREIVTHSQGRLRCERRELIQHELDRIQTYQNKGDLASTGAILNYLNWRNNISN